MYYEYNHHPLLSNFQIKLKIIDHPDGYFRYMKNKYKITYLVPKFLIKSKVTKDSLLHRKSSLNKFKKIFWGIAKLWLQNIYKIRYL